jgi:thiol-disulfide isomerase/thioredoxin
VWAQRGLELDRIPALVQQTLASPNPLQTALKRQSDPGTGASQSLVIENQRWTATSNAWSVLVATYVKTRHLDKARSIMADWDKALKERRQKAEEIKGKLAMSGPGPNRLNAMESSIIAGTSNDEYLHYQACARLAGAEGRAVDALIFYQSSLRLRYGRPETIGDMNDQEDVQEAERLWKKTGGSQAGWAAWKESIRTIPMATTRTISQPRWSAVNRSIPEFSLRDQNGKSWTLAGLKGKTTLINVWATWCGPCRAELPLLEKLYEQTKDRRDIRIITMNVDQDSALIAPFLRENKLSFPTLPAKSFVDGFAGPLSIPTTWISDRTGTIRVQIVGFSGSSSDWVSQTLKQIESVR